MQPRVVLVSVFTLAVVFSFEGVVQRVKDGDTLVIGGEGGPVVCRLYAIDAPEKSQPLGAEAAEALKDLVDKSEVVALLTGARSYGREVCVIRKGGRNINAEMLRLGMAWAARPHIKTEDEKRLYVGAEDYARGKGLGLWNSPGALPPWQWRKLRRAER